MASRVSSFRSRFAILHFCVGDAEYDGGVHFRLRLHLPDRSIQTIASYLNGHAHGTLEPIPWSGIGWLAKTARFVLVVAAAVTILGLQYFRRKTLTSRFMIVVFGLVILATQFLPWRPAFALEQRLSQAPNAGTNAVVAFDSALGKFRSPSGLGASSEHARRFEGEEHTSVSCLCTLPVSIQTLLLLTDRVEVRLINSDGKIAFHGIGEEVEVVKEGPRPTEDPVYQEVQVPGIHLSQNKGSAHSS